MPRTPSTRFVSRRLGFPAASVLAAVFLAACSSTSGGSAAPSPAGGGSSAPSPSTMAGSTAPSAAAGASAAAAQALEGPRWELTGYVGADGKTVSAIGASATFSSGKVTGNSGCNDYTASYTLAGEKLTIGQVASTTKACGPAETVLETAYLAALGKVASYSIAGETLELRTSGGTAGLTYVAAKPLSLTGTRWVATAVNNGTGGVASVVAGTTLTALFGPGGTVVGSGGCNDYNGPYTTAGTGVKIGPLAATRKLCGTPAGVDEQEASYLAALQKATTYAFKGSVLELRNDTGALLVSFKPTAGNS